MRGYGKGSYPIPVAISNSKAQKLRKEGIKIFNSREEAIAGIRSR